MDLGPHTHRYNSYNPCEDNLADHGSHLRPGSFGPSLTSSPHYQGCARPSIGFNPFPLPPLRIRAPFSPPSSHRALSSLPLSVIAPRCAEMMLTFIPCVLSLLSIAYSLPPVPSSFSPSPIPSHCAITVEPWKTPRNTSSHRFSPGRCKPQLNPLRHRRVAGTQPLGPKILRGIVPSARSGWSRAAASCFVP